MVEKIYTMTTEEEIRNFCNTETSNGEILGSFVRHRNNIPSYVTKIEIYSHDVTTKMYLLDGTSPVNFFALAYDEEGEPCWYYPAQAISNREYIPVMDEHESWSWNLISEAVLEHITGKYTSVRLCDDGSLAYINSSFRRRRNSYERKRAD